ncbi:Alpha-barbatene synthase [Raphanus sativus]|uniref:Alpha-barbatene synthase isoform X2 n=1 Tax=Raphanus sativus TaxID=3726 RepID=A0A6J0LNX5_RAPSA|nr:alpha-barbatene synthase isoform X2 [Raphanus sativus]KAJ4901657.1 Alpha-barbatene synthase [Raphanus sativus]
MEAGRNQDQESCFIFSKLAPSQWADYFLNVTNTDSDLELLAKEIEVVKPKVRENFFMLSSEEEDAVKRKILLIHLLESLGLAYHFEKEIEETLKHAFEKMEDLINGENDLYTISIMFRAFRTYGHNMPSDVFNRFKGNDGKFKECMIEDVKGLLSFYEAVHFGTTTDHILDEALSFSVDHLEQLASGLRESPPHVLKHVQNALYIPQHRKTQVLVAKEYISFYEQEEDRDDTLLKLAKLNFKFLRLHYIYELKTVIMWWKGLDHVQNLPLGIRERTIESWFSTLMIYFEPKFSLGRIMTAKFVLATTCVDDFCDTYGSVPEVESLVDCLERWDPDYMENCQSLIMKTTFKLVMYLFKEFEEVMKLHGRSFALENVIEEFKIFARSELEHLKWARTGHVPNFDEYVETGGAAAGTYSTIACSIMGLEETGKKIDFEWLISRPNVVRFIAKKTRLMDDIMDFEEDMNSGYSANALNYYMKQHGVTKEEAIREIQKMVGDVNKSINEECLKPTNVSRSVLMVALNFGRMVDVLCTSDDVYNHRGGKLKEYLIALLVDPIHL